MITEIKMVNNENLQYDNYQVNFLKRYSLAALPSNKLQGIANLIRNNMLAFDTSETALIGTMKRINNLIDVYIQKGNRLFIINNSRGMPVACAGLGTFHGLPLGEQIGEIRDLVVKKKYRNKGLGKQLIHACIMEAKKIGYKRLYLETSSHMQAAQNIFKRKGFKPVKERPKNTEKSQPSPCYFILEEIDSITCT